MPEPALAKRPNLAQRSVRDALPCRLHPYWALLEFSRHVGYQKQAGQPTFWMCPTSALMGQIGVLEEGRISGAS